MEKHPNTSDFKKNMIKLIAGTIQAVQDGKKKIAIKSNAIRTIMYRWTKFMYIEFDPNYFSKF